MYISFLDIMHSWICWLNKVSKIHLFVNYAYICNVKSYHLFSFLWIIYLFSFKIFKYLKYLDLLFFNILLNNFIIVFYCLLMWHWLIRIHRFQVHISTVRGLHTACVSTIQSQVTFSHHVFQLFYLFLSPHPYFSGNHHTDWCLCLWLCLSCLLVCCSQFSIPHMTKILF